MAGKIYTRTKMQTLSAVYTGLFEDLKAAGLTAVLPVAGTTPPVTAGNSKFVFDSSALCNPLHATQPWRIVVDLEGASAYAGRIRIAIATPLQITKDGATSTFPGPADPTGIRTMGQLGKAYNKPTGGAVGDCFVTRNVTNKVYDAGTTVSTLLVVTPRGVFFQYWEENNETAPVHSTFCVQVPVNKDTGVPLSEDKSPIFCVYNCDNTGFFKFVVSESDVARPSASLPADSNTKNSNAIINSKEQVSIARGNKYLVTLPNRLNTDRYAYSEELDMIGYLSSDIIGEGSEISVTLYGEETPRVYRALKSHGPDNTQVRLMVLVENGGVPAV